MITKSYPLPVRFGSRQTMAMNAPGRVTSDEVAILDRVRQSSDQADWVLTNLYASTPREVENVATSEIVMMPRDGYGPGRYAIDAGNELTRNPVQTNPKVPLHPQSRAIATVPFMGSGRGNPYIEGLLQRSEQVRERKSRATVTDTFFQNQFTPLIPKLARSLQNPVHYVPSLSDPSWVRGGAMSRNLVRDRLEEQDTFQN